MIRRPPRSALFPCATLFRSRDERPDRRLVDRRRRVARARGGDRGLRVLRAGPRWRAAVRVDRRAGDHVGAAADHRDRKSTRLNSSHANISYAVFCLKKITHSSIRDDIAADLLTTTTDDARMNAEPLEIQHGCNPVQPIYKKLAPA